MNPRRRRHARHRRQVRKWVAGRVVPDRLALASLPVAALSFGTQILVRDIGVLFEWSREGSP